MRETKGESAAVTARATPSLDLIFDLLSNRRRRYVLYYLHDQPDGVATMDEVTDGVLTLQSTVSNADSGAEPGACPDPEPGSDERRQQLRTELQHTHLPKLADAGVIEHDRRSETIRYWTHPSLAEWLEHARHKELS